MKNVLLDFNVISPSSITNPLTPYFEWLSDFMQYPYMPPVDNSKKRRKKIFVYVCNDGKVYLDTDGKVYSSNKKI